MYYSKYFTIFQEASLAGCVSASDLAKYIKRNGYSCKTDACVNNKLVKQ